MIFGVVINLSILIIFKYKYLIQPLVRFSSDCQLSNCLFTNSLFTNFFALALPIGISFYTFHGISLIVDSWRKSVELKENISFISHTVNTALYLSFFPQLVAGPIILSKDFYSQLATKKFKDIP